MRKTIEVLALIVLGYLSWITYWALNGPDRLPDRGHPDLAVLVSLAGPDRDMRVRVHEARQDHRRPEVVLAVRGSAQVPVGSGRHHRTALDHQGAVAPGGSRDPVEEPASPEEHTPAGRRSAAHVRLPDLF